MHNPQLPNREAAFETVHRIDRDALDRWRAIAAETPGHDMCSVNANTLARLIATIDYLVAIPALIPSPDQGEGTAKHDAGVEQLIAEWERLERAWHDALPQVQGDPGDGGEAGREMCQFLYEHSEELRAALATPPVDSAKLGEGDPVILITVESEHERAIFTFVDRAQSEIFLADCRKRNAFHVTAIDERATTTAARAAEGLDEMLENDNAA